MPDTETTLALPCEGRFVGRLLEIERDNDVSRKGAKLAKNYEC